jgi:DNA-binding CsgD family transcriptional regulator
MIESPFRSIRQRPGRSGCAALLQAIAAGLKPPSPIFMLRATASVVLALTSAVLSPLRFLARASGWHVGRRRCGEYRPPPAVAGARGPRPHRRGASCDHDAQAAGQPLPEQGLPSRGDRQGHPHLGARAEHLSASVAEGPPYAPGGDADEPPHELLSERELQVFLRMARGETISHMAASMSLSLKTVSTYRTRVIEKMGLTSNSDPTDDALKNGLIQ